MSYYRITSTSQLPIELSSHDQTHTLPFESTSHYCGFNAPSFFLFSFSFFFLAVKLLAQSKVLLPSGSVVNSYIVSRLSAISVIDQHSIHSLIISYVEPGPSTIKPNLCQLISFLLQYKPLILALC
ncbi:hypothetical protein BJX64DRAFT_40968 [Aspergillus heterothallicus]